VLRRPELLAPAGIVNAGEAAAGAAAAAATVPPSAPPIGAAAPPVPAPAQAPPPVPPPLTGPDTFGGPVYRDTVGIGPSMEDSGGIGGLFASSEPDEPPAGPPAHGTAVFPVGGPPPQPTAAPGRLLDQRMVEQRPSGQNSSRNRLLLVGAALLVVVLVVLGVIVLLGRTGGGNSTAAHSAGASASPTAQLRPGATQEVDGVSFTLQAVKVDDTCVGHAYGAVGDFFNATNCAGLSRALYTAQVDGKPAVLAVAEIRMPNASSATALRALADRDGTGNVNDLLREGVTYNGAPAQLLDSQYASAPKGDIVTIVVSAWAAGRAAGSSAPLDAVASSGLTLNMPNPPGR